MIWKDSIIFRVISKVISVGLMIKKMRMMRMMKIMKIEVKVVSF